MGGSSPPSASPSPLPSDDDHDVACDNHPIVGCALPVVVAAGPPTTAPTPRAAAVVVAVGVGVGVGAVVDRLLFLLPAKVFVLVLLPCWLHAEVDDDDAAAAAPGLASFSKSLSRNKT